MTKPRHFETSHSRYSSMGDRQGVKGKLAKAEVGRITPVFIPLHPVSFNHAHLYNQPRRRMSVKRRGMGSFEDVFRHLPEHRVVVCVQCEYAVRPVHVLAHLQQEHRRLAQSSRESIARTFSTLIGVANRKEDIQYPSPQDVPVTGLPVHSDGLRCTAVTEQGSQCRYICRTMQGIQQHCKQQHGWGNRQKRGDPIAKRQKHSPNKMWQDGQHCQRFFEHPHWKTYFAVTVLPPPQERSIVDIGEREKRADALIAKHMADVEAYKRERPIGGEGSRYMPMAWLDFTGWHRHLGDFKMDVLRYVQPAADEKSTEEGMSKEANGDGIEVDEEDGGLADACRATRALIRTAMKKCQDADGETGVGKPALEHINRREVGAWDKERPFYAKHTAQSIDKYSARWTKLLRYIWRTADKESRPKYRLTDRQHQVLGEFKRLARREGDGRVGVGRASVGREREWREAMQMAGLTFWIAMFDHELRDSEYESGIISGLAVLALNDRSGWMTAISYTPVCAAMMTVLRAFVVYRAWRTRTDSIRMYVASGLTESKARDTAPSVVDGVTEMADRFMTIKEFRGKPTPMDRIYRQKAYGIAIRDGENVAPRTAWSKSEDELRIDDIAFTMDDIRSVVHGVLESARVRLDSLMFINETSGPGQRPPLDIDRLFDNPAETDEDWNFLKDSRSEFSVEGHKWLWKRIQKDDALGLRFTDGASADAACLEDVKWNETGVEEYFRQVRRFKEDLIVLVHMSAGAPARSTELTSITTANPMGGRGRRSVYIERGMVAFVPDYGKMTSHSGKVKVIHRYTPREVGKLVVYYLWIVEPFVQLLQAGSRQQREYSRSLWEPKPERSWEDGWGDDGVGAEEVEGGEEVEEGEEEGVNTDEAVDSGRTHEWEEIGNDMPMPSPPEPLNVDGFWNTDRVRRAIQSEWMSRFEVNMTINRWRQCYPAIQRKFTRDREVAGMLDVLYDDRHGRAKKEAVSHIIEDAVERQSGHSREREEQNYGRGVFDSPFTTESLQAAFRRVSVDWHRFLRFDSAFESEQANPDVRERIRKEREEECFRRWKWIRRIDIDAQLKRIVGDTAEFRGLQRPGLTAIIERQLRVLIVMRTGGGKSLFFMLPAAGSQDGVTVVVVPLNALRTDLKQRCDRIGIASAEWEGGRRPPYHARIVFVTPEAAVQEAFGRFMNEKVASGQLDRVVVDECHVIIEEEEQPFRPDILRLYKMTEKHTQVVFLTATLPPIEEPQFFRAIGLERTDVVLFRDVTTRPNIAYSVVEYERTEMREAVQRIVEEKKRQYPLPGQIIVYCKQIQQATTLAQALGCSVFHRKVGTAEEKGRILRRFTAGAEQVITATNAFGLGIDAPSIRVVIHVGLRPSMKQYAQESGRAGRDERASEAIIMRANWTDEQGHRQKESEYRFAAPMKEFLSGERCRRIPLDRLMDGRVDRVTCEVGEHRCDVCRGQVRGRNGQRNIVNVQPSRERVGKRRRSETVGRVPDDVEEGVPIEDEDISQEGCNIDTNMNGCERADRAERPGDDPEVRAVQETQRVEHQREQERQEVERRRKEELQDAEDEREREVRAEYEQNSLRQFTIELGERARRIGSGGQAVDELIDRFRSYQGKCAICRAHGISDRSHTDWRKCPVEGGMKELMTRTWASLGEVQFVDYARCTPCWAPQSVCHTWIEGRSNGRPTYRYCGQHRCQYMGVLRDATAAVLTIVGWDGDGVGNVVDAWIIEEAEKHGIREETDRGAQARQFFGAKIRDGVVEMSGLCRLFQIWG